MDKKYYILKYDLTIFIDFIKIIILLKIKKECNNFFNLLTNSKLNTFIYLFFLKNNNIFNNNYFNN